MNPTTITNYAAVPQQLKDFPNWVCWRIEGRNGELTKIPYDPKTGRNASPNDPQTWGTFKQAIAAFDGGNYEGIGFEFSDTPYEGIDFDGLLNADRSADPYALAILAAARDPYCDVSPSKTGFHTIFEGHLPSGAKNKFVLRKHYGLEIYDTARYFTVTGDHFSGSGLPKVDSDLIYLLVSQFKNANFKSLWIGDTSAFESDDSKADFALMCELARLTKCNPGLMETYFSESALAQRDKWRDRPDYRQSTIKEAIERVGASNKVKPTQAIEFHTPARPDPKGDYVVAPLAGQKDGWFPLGDISLVGGASGTGKTTLLFQLLFHQKHGYEFLGHRTFGRLFHVLAYDRRQNSFERTMERMNMLPSDVPSTPLPLAMGIAAVQTIINEIEKLNPTPGVVLLEGLDMLLDDTNKKSIVSPFMRQLQDVAAHFHIALIGSVGAPKSKQGEAYAAKRDKLSGSEAWGRNCETVVVIEFSAEDDGTTPQREITVLPRNAPAEKFSMEFQNGRLVLVPPTKVEDEKPILGRPNKALQDAIRFIEQELHAGPRESKELVQQAYDQENISRATFFRAAAEIKIIKSRSGRTWELAPMHGVKEDIPDMGDMKIGVTGELQSF